MFEPALFISKKKFTGLSARRQHTILAALAESFLASKDYEAFRNRYNELHSWTELDMYEPAYWLSNEEALQEYLFFHQKFGCSPHVMVKDTAEQKTLTWAPVHSVEIAIDQVRSPYNVGSVLRLIDNVGFRGLIHSTTWLRKDHPQLKKAARGAENWVPVNYCEGLVNYLWKSNLPLIGLENDPRAVPIYSFTPPAECIVVLGNEEYGIARVIRELCQHLVTIPVYGYKKSMNVHHALAIFAGYYIRLYGQKTREKP